jgi:tetratricopeptide (TPR) repeat protein
MTGMIFGNEEDELMTIHEISELIVDGFEKLVIYPGEKASKYDAIKGCDDMLLAWRGLKLFMDESNISDIWALERKQFPEFKKYNIYPSFVFQLLADELHNAGIQDKRYFEKRIEYCTEFQKYIGDDRLTIENMRSAIADSYYGLGDEAECDRLYSEWIEADPKWGRGYIGWASNYEFEIKDSNNTEKAAGIYERVLGIADIRDRHDVILQALQFYKGVGDKDKLDWLRDELSKSKPEGPDDRPGHSQMAASSGKVGRNDPCPCGSGKKYKKCCGS